MRKPPLRMQKKWKISNNVALTTARVSGAALGAAEKGLGESRGSDPDPMLAPDEYAGGGSVSEMEVLVGENCEALVDCRGLPWEAGTVVFASALADDAGAAAFVLLLEDGPRYFHIAKVYEHMNIRIMFMKLSARVLLSSGMLAMPKGASVVHRA